MDVGGVQVLGGQRSARSSVDGNVFSSEVCEDIECVPGRNIDWHVAGNGCDAQDVRTSCHRQGERYGVVDSSVDIDNHR